jgi:hypothetical protein
MKALIVNHNKVEILEQGNRLAPRRKARQAEGRVNYFGKIFDRYSPTFAALASLRATFRVSVATLPR